MHDILIVDDEPAICWALKKLLASSDRNVRTAASAEEGLAIAESEVPQVVFLDVRLPSMDGLTALSKFLSLKPTPKVIIMTAFGDLETAVAAVKKQAFDYLVKPFSLETAKKSCLSALAAIDDAEPPQHQKPSDWVGIIGQSPAMQQVFRQIALLADSELPVLITGPTGTGKELVAQALHRYSRRSSKPFVPIAPVAFSAELMESELFGHARGAYTGAHQSQAGWFERAGEGTIFLDEIGELPPNLQVKLLRVLENGEYLRVGDSKLNYSQARVVAATNQDLGQAVADGRFREDLYFRLNAAQLVVPPLRNRTEDIPALCQHFLGQLESGHNSRTLSQEVLAELQQRSWPGNVRELKNVIQRAAMLSAGRAISLDDLPVQAVLNAGDDLSRDSTSRDDQPPGKAPNTPEITVTAWTEQQMNQEPASYKGQFYKIFLDQFEQPLLQAVLASVQGNKAKAAEILGIHRGTLRDRLRSREGSADET